MSGHGNIVIGINIEKTINGLRLTSPHIDRFSINVGGSTFGQLIGLLEPAMNLRMIQENISIRNMMLVVEGGADELIDDAPIDHNVSCKLIMVPERVRTSCAPAPHI